MLNFIYQDEMATILESGLKRQNDNGLESPISLA
jgi:hypothetical protein